MSFDINRLPYFGSIAQVSGINPAPVSTKQVDTSLKADKFESSNPEKYTSEIMIKKLAENNPEINKIISNAGIKYELNLKDLKELLDGHCTDTRNIAEGIVKNLPFSLESRANLKAIKDAAYLHDIGKVFIPQEILDKNGKLTPAETEIVHKHPELGYELLKNTDIDKKTLNLIRNHHQNAKKSGYPFVDKDFNADLDLQILSLADKYSALTEDRPYKKAMTREQALTIIRKDVRERKINPLVYTALVNYTDEAALEKLNVK